MGSDDAPDEPRLGELVFFLAAEGLFIHNLATASERPPWRLAVSIAIIALGVFVIVGWVRDWRLHRRARAVRPTSSGEDPRPEQR
jgi:prepilin signal peptidase PulO-like enzyme (type II secretory pathway)